MQKTQLYRKKKATLMIQHLESIYTMMPSSYEVVHHGFLAVHHDEILAIGEGEGWEYVDKDTRILEGRGHMLIPGMIDVSISLPKRHAHTMSHDQLRHMKEHCEIWMKHGTLIGNLTSPSIPQDQKLLQHFQAPYEFDFLQRDYLKPYEIVTPLCLSQKQISKRFCISTKNEITNCLDQLLCAKLAYRMLSFDAYQILAACTIYPAQMLGLPRLGTLAKGKIANILMLEGQQFEDVLERMHGDEHMQIIKEGTRRYPNIII